MTEQAYLPAMGRQWLLPLYDPFTRLAGVHRVHRRLLDRADAQPGQRLLDIGCGTGNLLTLLMSRSPAVEATGIDPDPAALRRARAKAARAGLDVRYEQAYAGRLPLPDGHFDLVLSSLMLHHLDEEERGRALREVRRVLRPGGRLHLLDVAGRHGHRHPGLAAVEPDRVLAAMFDAGLTDVAEDGSDRIMFSRIVYYRASR